MAHAYLFLGAANIGKTHLALKLAAALNCTGERPPCGECVACVKTDRGTHPDVFLLDPGDARIKIDQVRELQHQLALSPYEGRRRICILADFQSATIEAANALLKTLEEPPSRVVIILTATDASLLLPTIVSRCQAFFLRRVTRQRIEDALIERWHERPDRAKLIAHLSTGRVGWAIRAVEDPSVLAQRQRFVEELMGVLPQGRTARIQAAERLSKRADLPAVLQLWQTWWRDVLLISGGCAELVANLDHLDALALQARSYGLNVAKTTIRSIESALQQLDQNVNARLALEVLLLSWPRAAEPA